MARHSNKINHLIFIHWNTTGVYSGFSGNDTLGLFPVKPSISGFDDLFDRNTAPGLGYGLI